MANTVMEAIAPFVPEELFLNTADARRKYFVACLTFLGKYITPAYYRPPAGVDNDNNYDRLSRVEGGTATDLFNHIFTVEECGNNTFSV